METNKLSFLVTWAVSTANKQTNKKKLEFVHRHKTV